MFVRCTRYSRASFTPKNLEDSQVDETLHLGRELFCEVRSFLSFKDAIGSACGSVRRSMMCNSGLQLYLCLSLIARNRFLSNNRGSLLA
jgi:hypothetical protein